MGGENNDPWAGLRGNLLLQTLAAHDAIVLSASLKRVYLSPGVDVPTEDEDRRPLVYFPESAVICLGLENSGLTGFQTGLVGNEGILGWANLLGISASCHTARPQLHGGTALVMPAARPEALCAINPVLLRGLMRFAHLFALQMAANLLSNLHDPLERRLCRWILMFHDRIAGDELAITHDALALLLHTRRASITDALHIVEGEQLLKCGRGRIIVRDRAALEAWTGEAYGASERRYRALIGPFGKSAGL